MGFGTFWVNFSETGSHWLIYLNVCSAVGGAVWEELQKCSLVGGGVSLEVGFEVSKSTPCQCFFSCFLVFVSRFDLSATAPVPCLTACLPATVLSDGQGL